MGGLLLSLILPSVALAHAELVSSTPADGAVVENPSEVVLRFDEPVVGNSSFTLHDSSGATVATGSPDPVDPTSMRATFPPLGPGVYTVEWTSVAEDTGVERGTFTFTVTEPTAAPPTPTPVPSDEPATEAPPTATEAPSPTVPPTAPPGGSGGDTTGDVLLPIAVVGLLIGGGLAFFLRRRSAA